MADILGVNAVFRAVNKNRIRILMYHGVTKSTFDAPYWTQLDYESFVWQMNYVKKHFISMEASRFGTSNNILNGVIITFDDGLRNVYDNALPVLEKLNLKAICFVLPELSQKGQSIWPDRVYEAFMRTHHDAVDLTEFSLPRYDLKNQAAAGRARFARELVASLKSSPHGLCRRVLEQLETEYIRPEVPSNPEFRLMTMEQIKALSEGGVFEIGLHTDTHPILSTQTREEQTAEIKGCKNKIEAAGIKHTNIFAYPNGRYEDFNDDSIDLLNEMGIRAAFTTEDGLYSPGDDLFRVKRIPVGSDLNRHEFAARLSGFYYFIKAFFGR